MTKRAALGLGLGILLMGCSSEDDVAGSRTNNAASSSGGSSSSSSSSGGASSSGDVDGGSGSGSGSGDGGGGISPSNGSSKPNCKYTAHKTGLTQLQQAGGGLSFNTYAPTSYDPNVGHGVVVLMHGQDSDGVPELNALWKAIADQESLVLIAPKGSRPATTGDATKGNWATADLEKVLAIMKEVDDCYNVLTKKHLLWGFSAGTFYGYLLGLGAAEEFSGLAMGGANTSFARQNGYAPKDAKWKIPVSHVHGVQDFNPIAQTRQDKTDFEAAGHMFTLHEHAGGHSITPQQVRMQYDDLKSSISP